MSEVDWRRVARELERMADEEPNPHKEKVMRDMLGQEGTAKALVRLAKNLKAMDGEMTSTERKEAAKELCRLAKRLASKKKVAFGNERYAKALVMASDHSFGLALDALAAYAIKTGHGNIGRLMVATAAKVEKLEESGL